jgi:hypothetical protein
VLYGETADGPWFFDMLRRGTDTREMRDTLIFGQPIRGRPWTLRRPLQHYRMRQKSVAATASAKAGSQLPSRPRA